MRKFEIIFGVARVPVDFLAVASAFLLARWVRSFTDLIPGIQLPIGYIPTINEFISFLILGGLSLVVIFALNGMYSLRTSFKFWNEFIRVVFLVTAWIMLLFAYFFLTREFFFSRLVMIYGWGLATFLITCGRGLIRLTQKIFWRAGYGRTKVVVLGENGLKEEVEKILQAKVNYKLVVLPKLDLTSLKEDIDEIIQTTSSLAGVNTQELIDFCRLNNVRYRFVPDLLELERRNVSVTELGGLPVLELKPTPLDGWGKVLKRIFDLLCSALGVVLLAPLFILISFLIKLDSRGPVFYRARRVGAFGKEFKMYKFRTMVDDADKLKNKLAQLNEREGPLFKLRDDPRITRIGRFLRRTSLDELPQLFNVFKSEMSLVGPRPHEPAEVARYAKHHKRLLTIKPGITALAAISGRSSLPFEKEVQLDTHYIENWSLLWDIIIILKTVWVVLKGDHND